MPARALIAAWAILFSSAFVQAAPALPGEFRGYVATNLVVRERLFKENSGFELGLYVQEFYNPNSISLLDLLGTYKSGFSVGQRFRNGVANPLNVLLWRLLFARLADDVSGLCLGQRRQDFNDAFAASVAPFCAWPGIQSKEAALESFWLATMDTDAPESEFEVWRAFWLGPAGQGLKGREAIEWMMLSMLNNPYFLLRQ